MVKINSSSTKAGAVGYSGTVAGRHDAGRLRLDTQSSLKISAMVPHPGRARVLDWIGLGTWGVFTSPMGMRVLMD